MQTSPILCCSECDMTTSNKYLLKTHFRTKHCYNDCSSSDTICDDCLSSLKLIADFPRLSNVDSYKRNKDEGLKCNKCETVAINKYLLKKHYRLKHCSNGCSKSDQVCKDCLTGLKEIVDFPRLNNQDGATAIQCNQCDKVVCNKYALKSHYRRKHCSNGCLDTDTICEDCIEGITQVADYKSLTYDRDLFECNKCDLTSNNKYLLKKHYQTKHCANHCYKTDKVCTVCVEGLLQIAEFPRLMHNPDSLQCTECDFSVTNKYILKKHYQNNHCKSNCYKGDGICEDCSVSLSKITRYPRLSHGHVQPPAKNVAAIDVQDTAGRYQCTECDMSTPGKFYLKRHYQLKHCRVNCLEDDEMCRQCATALGKIAEFPRLSSGIVYRKK